MRKWLGGHLTSRLHVAVMRTPELRFPRIWHVAGARETIADLINLLKRSTSWFACRGIGQQLNFLIFSKSGSRHAGLKMTQKTLLSFRFGVLNLTS